MTWESKSVPGRYSDYSLSLPLKCCHSVFGRFKGTKCELETGVTQTLTVTAAVAGCISCPSLQISTKARILLHFVPRFGRERDRGGEPGHYSRLSVHLASAGQLLRKKEKPSLVFFLPPLFSAFFCSLSFLFWRQISRIKYGSHMLLLTIGIHRSTGPTATQTDGQREEDGWRRRQRGE